MPLHKNLRCGQPAGRSDFPGNANATRRVAHNRYYPRFRTIKKGPATRLLLYPTSAKPVARLKSLVRVAHSPAEGVGMK
jgi:hypothetical protein